MDTQYWNNFYNNNSKVLNSCSDFCKFVLDFFEKNKKKYNIKNVLDAGCGNGRDGRVLASKYKVLGIDNCGFKLDNTDNFTFKNENFISIDKSDFDLIYSRFTFHSITNEEHLEFLKSINKYSYLAIEARSTKDQDKEEHYGKTHFRNYIDFDYLKKLLKTNGFEILYLTEDKNLAIYKDENPTCVRVICRKLI